VQSPEELERAIHLVAGALDREGPGRALAAALAEDFAALEAALPRAAPPPRALFLLAAGGGAPMASGRGTAAAAMLQLAGARSAVEGDEGYRPLSAEAHAARDLAAALHGEAAMARLPERPWLREAA
jgi:iron complex transport system substrate-binding protein